MVRATLRCTPFPVPSLDLHDKIFLNRQGSSAGTNQFAQKSRSIRHLDIMARSTYWVNQKGRSMRHLDITARSTYWFKYESSSLFNSLSISETHQTTPSWHQIQSPSPGMRFTTMRQPLSIEIPTLQDRGCRTHLVSTNIGLPDQFPSDHHCVRPTLCDGSLRGRRPRQSKIQPC
jgi:hypothetical protein